MSFRSHIFTTCNTGNILSKFKNESCTSMFDTLPDQFPPTHEVRLNALMVVCSLIFIVGCVGPLSVDRMIEKAWRLIESGRVEQISEDSWSVVGDHGTYTVARDYKGKVTCNCPGFRSKKKCSHSAAVIILTKLKR